MTIISYLSFYSEYGLRSENGFVDKKNDHDRYVKNILFISFFSKIFKNTKTSFLMIKKNWICNKESREIDLLFILLD